MERYQNVFQIGKYVLDGGALLHKVKWVKGESYKQTFHRYCDHVINKYGISTVVFDGYDIPSIKDHEHQRRTSVGKTSANIQVVKSNAAHNNQDAFFANTSNKLQFINH